MNIMAVDPGRDKCGLALLSSAGEILWRRVVPTESLAAAAGGLLKEQGAGKLVLGNGTTHGEAERRLREALPGLDIEVVDEYRTTEMARKLYWQVNPPRGWRTFLPTTLQTPPEPVDDLVAVILARRALGYGNDKGER